MTEWRKSWLEKTGQPDSVAYSEADIAEMYDPADITRAEEEAAAAAEAAAVGGPAEQNLIEFENPFERREDPSFIPGVRFPKLGTIGTQDFGNFFTIPANIAAERVRLGGDLIDANNVTGYRPTDAEILAVTKKYNIIDNDRTIGKLLSSTSPEDLEAQALVYSRRQEREQQILVDNPGIVGMGTRILWNMADPTFLVAGSAAAGAITTRIANSATKTGAAIRFASDGLTKAERFKIGAATGLAVDVPLEGLNTLADPERDPLMSAGFLALTPILGGALNSIGRSRADELVEATKYLDNKLAENIEKPFKYQPVGTDGGAGGAAQGGPVPFMVDEDGIPGAPKRAGRFTIGTPLNYLARSADPIVRTVADRLSWNPNTRSRQGVTAAEGQKRVYEASAVRIRAGRQAAKRYFEKKLFQPNQDQLDDFFQQVGQHLMEVRISNDPDIIAATNEYVEGFADGLAYLKDPNYVPGRQRPPTVKPVVNSTGPGSPPAPPPAAPASPQTINAVEPDAPQAITEAAPQPSPAPAGRSVTPEAEDAATGAEEAQALASEGRFVVTDKEGEVVFSSDVREEAVEQARELSYSTPPEETFVVSDKVKSPYFGRKSFGGEGTATVEPKAAPATAAVDEPIVQPDAPVEPGKGSDYFGRKSFREKPEAEKAKVVERSEAIEKVRQIEEPKPSAKSAEIPEANLREVPEEAPTGDPVADAIEGLAAAGPKREAFEEVLAVVERMKAPEAKAIAQAYANLDAPPKTKNKAITVIREHFAQQLIERKKDVRAKAKPKPSRPAAPVIVKQAKEDLKPAAEKVIEVEDKAPSRVLMGRQLNSYIKQAEEIATKLEPGSEVQLLDALTYLQKVYKGHAMGSSEGFRARYAEASNRLAQVLEDLPEGERLLAAIVEDMDSGMGRFAADEAAKRVLPSSRRTSAKDAVTEARAVDTENSAIAAAYDAIRAAFEYTGKGARPGTIKGVSVGAAAGAAATSTVALASAEYWLGGLEPEELSAAALVGAALGSAIAAVATKGRQKRWDMNTPGIAVFVGPNAAGADLQALKRAHDMETSGVDRDKIWKETVWGRGPTGGWITEADEPMGGLIDDLIDRNIPIEKALRAKRIFEIEPRLRATVIQTEALLRHIADTNDLGVAEVYDMMNPSLAVNTNAGPVERLRTFMHELNHVAQSFRGGKGAYEEDFDKLARQARIEADELWDAYVNALQTKQDDIVDEIYAAYEDAVARSDRYYNYLRQDIEAESRMVERRMGLSRKQRRDRPPWKDFDVPEDDLWTGTAGMRAFSLASDVRRFRADDWWSQNVQEGVFAGNELEGSSYWRMDTPDGQGVTVWTEEVDAGEITFNWDWNDNVDNMRLFGDNPNATPAQSARAFAFAQAAFERILREEGPNVMTFEGLKKAKPGRDASGHERVQEFLMGRGDAPGYVASKGTWKSKVKDPDTGEMVEVTRSAFAYSREGMDLGEVWQGIRLGNVSIEVVPTKGSAKPMNPASKPAQPATNAPPADNYLGLEEARFVDYDPAFLPRRFNKAGYDRVFLSPQFRGSTNALGNRIGQIIYRTNPTGLDEMAAARPTPISGEDLALRIGVQYAKTVAELMNPANKGKSPFRKVSLDDREAAKEIVRESLTGGPLADFDTEEAMEMILDLVAPIRKSSTENPRMRQRVQMQLDAEQDGDILDMFEWNAENLFVQYMRTTSGFAGLLKAGFRSESEVRNMIDEVRTNAGRDPKRQPRAKREVEMLEATLDAIMGRPAEDLMSNPHWTWLANQMRRYNYGRLMNNTGFLALSEVGGAIASVGLTRLMGMFPEFLKYYRQVRSGDPAVSENIFYLADITMGHGSAQVRSRVGQMADAQEGAFASIEDQGSILGKKIDTFTRKQANLVGRFSGMTPIQEFLRMSIVTAEAQDWVKAARAGKAPYSERRMAALGVGPEEWRRISAELRKWGDTQSPDSQRMVPNMDLAGWEDGDALSLFINSLDRNARRIVLEGDIGHQAFWLRNRPSAQLLFQFLSFPINAFSKHTGFALNVKDTSVGAEMMAMSLGGALGYLARTHATALTQDTDEERQQYRAERATLPEFGKAMFYYGAHLSVAPNVIDTAGQLGSAMNVPGAGPIFAKTRASGLAGDVVTGNPSYQFIDRSANVLGGLTEGTPVSEQDVQKVVRHFAPMGNHIVMNALLDHLLEFLPDEEGSVEETAQ
jgi:hypothetical protein